jgi:hypothetical protein
LKKNNEKFSWPLAVKFPPDALYCAAWDVDGPCDYSKRLHCMAEKTIEDGARVRTCSLCQILNKTKKNNLYL